MKTINNRIKALGQRIKEGRRAILLSQGEFAKKAGLSLDYICKIEEGGRISSFWALNKISRVLKIPPEKLLTGKAFFKSLANKIELSPKERAKIGRLAKNIEKILCPIK